MDKELAALFAANAKHAARNNESAVVGGGVYSPAELRGVATILGAAADMFDALQIAKATIKRLAKTDSANGTLDIIDAAIAKAAGK